MDFRSLLETVNQFPYTTKFKVSEIVPGWGELTKEEQDSLLSRFMVYVLKSRSRISFAGSQELRGIPENFDFVYEKDNMDKFEDYSYLELAVNTAYTLKKMEKGRRFILPELERENQKFGYNDSDWNIDNSEDTEKALNRMIEDGLVPYLKIAGETFGFTVYEKI